MLKGQTPQRGLYILTLEIDGINGKNNNRIGKIR